MLVRECEQRVAIRLDGFEASGSRWPSEREERDDDDDEDGEERELSAWPRPAALAALIRALP